MLRISTIEPNKRTAILNAEGDLGVENLQVLHGELSTLCGSNDRLVILNFADVSSASPEIIDTLRSFAAFDLYLMNCRPFIRNLLEAAGLSRMVLG